MRKLGEAIELLFNNLLLFAAITLTIWLPGNLVTYNTLYSGESDSEEVSVRLPVLIEVIFGPIYVGALIHSLKEIKSGRRPTYAGAMRMGFSCWGRLFVARFVTGLIITLASFLLIIPGIILAVRWALIDSIVVLEGGRDDPRGRSTVLTAGRRWPIAGTWLLAMLIPLFGTVFQSVLIDLVPAINTFAMWVFSDCIIDVLFLIAPIALFLYYWEAVQLEGAQKSVPDEKVNAPLRPLSEAERNNPYLPPQI